MDDHELELLLVDIESDRVERKSSPTDRDRIRQAICAFANDLPNHQQPGVIFIGVDDTGHCTHHPITDELLRKLADMRTDVHPFASMTVQKRTLSGCELAVILVFPASTPPVRHDGRVWVRVGPRRAIATPDEERRLAEKRRSLDIPFDVRPFPTASLDDLDLNLFQREYLPSALPSDILEQNERPVEQQLVSMRFATPGEPAVPTSLGILVVGTSPRTFIPGAYLHRSYESTHAPVRIHWFLDRIELLSPGGPFGQVTRTNFGQPGMTDYRNPHLAEAMKNLGYVQRFGMGIALARREMERNGNPPPEFVPEDTYILAILRRKS